MSIVSHSYLSKFFNQTSDSTTINGVTVPKGFVDVSAMVHASGKKLQDYLKSKDSYAFLIALGKSESLINQDTHLHTLSSKASEAQKQYVEQAIKFNLLIKVTDPQGGSYYAHSILAKDIARWCNPDFAVWAIKVIDHVINGDFQALTPEAEKAKIELQKTWQRIRDTGKLSRRSFTDSIKSYVERHPELSPDYRHWIYANASDTLNKGLFGMTAKQLRDHRQINDPLLRDTHTEAELKDIDRIETHAGKLVDKLDIEPVAAILEALEFYS